MHVYNSVQEKLDAVNKQSEKEKKKSKALENEIRDLQSEFELDRIDYLDTIRRQDQQLKLLQQILDKVQPCLRRDSNYCNIDKIKKEAIWDEDLQKWHLPEMSVVKTQFPNGTLGGGKIQLDKIHYNSVNLLKIKTRCHNRPHYSKYFVKLSFCYPSLTCDAVASGRISVFCLFIF